jgi:hypothetical protein
MFYKLLLCLLFASVTLCEDSNSLLGVSYRKDAYLTQYIEFGVPEPLTGGRLHIIGVATNSGQIGSVNLNGTILNMSTGLNPSDWLVDWVRVEPSTGLVIGQPFWVSLHSRSSLWDTALANNLVTTLAVMSNNNSSVILASGSFTLVKTPIRIMWVTSANLFTNIHIFVRNEGFVPATVFKAILCGIDITSSLSTSVRVIPARQTEVWVIPSNLLGSYIINAGTVWTLTIQFVESNFEDSIGGGIFWKEFFPIETWPHGSDCPFPTINDTAYALHRSHGIDTFFTEYHLDSSCNTKITSVDLVNTIAPANGFFVFPSFENGGTPFNAIKNESALAGIFLADEDDTVVDDKARILLARVLEARLALPNIPTYAGGASNRYTGAYSGITDIKGMDAYIGACAPHYALLAMPARGSYDYLINTRENQAPGPTWLYSQGFEEGWDSKTFKVNRQANSAEIAIQVASVVAASAKGMMLFETELKYLEDPISAPAWATLGTLLKETGALREYYRGGDATGMSLAIESSNGSYLNETILTEAILHPRAVIVIAINTAAVNDTYNDICCALGAVACHFTFVSSPIMSVGITLPISFTVVDTFEIFNATVLQGFPQIQTPFDNFTLGIKDITLGVKGPGGELGASNPTESIVRTFVLAADNTLRGEIEKALEG